VPPLRRRVPGDVEVVQLTIGENGGQFGSVADADFAGGVVEVAFDGPYGYDE
jgi:hypothetical protein